MTTRRTTPFTFELATAFDSRKSFYGKARVTVNPAATVELRSYGTIVATIDIRDPYNKRVTLGPAWNYSATTLRHVKEFLRQQGFVADSATQMRKDYL